MGICIGELTPLEANKHNNPKTLLYSNQPLGTLLTGQAKPLTLIPTSYILP